MHITVLQQHRSNVSAQLLKVLNMQARRHIAIADVNSYASHLELTLETW
jgi:hypothetical protein